MRKDGPNAASLLAALISIIVVVVLFNPFGLGTAFTDAFGDVIDLATVYGLVGIVIGLMLFFAWRIVK